MKLLLANEIYYKGLAIKAISAMRTVRETSIIQ